LFLNSAPAMAVQRVFVTSTTSSGDLGGLAGADATCQQLADGEGLGGTWIAWLSIAGVDAISRLVGNGPFVRADNSATIAEDRAQLTSGTLFNEIERTESGDIVPGTAWTGTDPDGTAADSGNFCNG
jgi:hypothetical protein